MCSSRWLNQSFLCIFSFCFASYCSCISFLSSEFCWQCIFVQYSLSFELWGNSSKCQSLNSIILAFCALNHFRYIFSLTALLTRPPSPISHSSASSKKHRAQVFFFFAKVFIFFFQIVTFCSPYLAQFSPVPLLLCAHLR